MQVTGTPSFPFHMPASDRVEYPEEEMLRQRAIALAQRGYQAGISIDGGDPYLGKAVTAGDLYYQTPRVPNNYFVQHMTDGDMRPPYMVPGTLDDAIRTQLAYQDERSGGIDWGDPRMRQARAMQAIQDEARIRASQGQPFQAPMSENTRRLVGRARQYRGSNMHPLVNR